MEAATTTWEALRGLLEDDDTTVTSVEFRSMARPRIFNCTIRRSERPYSVSGIGQTVASALHDATRLSNERIA